MRSHHVMQNVFACHDVLKRSNGYSNQSKLSKREAKLSFAAFFLYSTKKLQCMLQDTLHYLQNYSTILLQRCPEKQKTMSTPRPLNTSIFKRENEN